MMILLCFLITTSILLASTFSALLAQIVVDKIGISIFNQTITNTVLAHAKTIDILNSVFFVIASLILFVIFTFIYKGLKLSKIQQILFGLVNFIYSLIFFIATLFAPYSGTQTVFFTSVWYLGMFLISFLIPKDENLSWKVSKRQFLNGIVVGFYCLILIHNISTSIALPISVFLSMPILFCLFSTKFRFLENPIFALLILSFAFPFNIFALTLIFVITIALIGITYNKIAPKILLLTDKIYPLLILFIFTYNPMFYLGNFDSIEEGFWAGWLQRLVSGQVIYRDFAAYHPPLLIDGLFIFTKAFGYNLYNFRLYFHILQITGLAIFFYSLMYLVESKWIKIAFFALILAYSEGLVRNNMEIRVGSALLPLLFTYLYLSDGKFKYLFLSGFFSVIAILISIETGFASLISVCITTFLLSKKQNLFKNISFVITGILSVSIPFTLILIIQGSFYKFVEYLTYYITVFSKGYMNIALDRPPTLTLIQWNVVYKFISTPMFIFTISSFISIAGICFFAVNWHKKTLNPKIIFVTSISILTLIISRSALGRSDSYHISFIWILAILPLAYFIYRIRSFSSGLAVAISCFIILAMCGDAIQNTLQNQLIKLQTYGNLSGSYPSYSSNRAKITSNIDVDPKEMDNLVNFVDSSTKPDEKIFVYPLAPEIYFLTNRNNSTSFDTPTAFNISKYQTQTIEELKQNPPKLIIYIGIFKPIKKQTENTNDVNLFIQENFHSIRKFGVNEVLIKNT